MVHFSIPLQLTSSSTIHLSGTQALRPALKQQRRICAAAVRVQCSAGPHHTTSSSSSFSAKTSSTTPRSSTSYTSQSIPISKDLNRPPYPSQTASSSRAGTPTPPPAPSATAQRSKRGGSSSMTSSCTPGSRVIPSASSLFAGEVGPQASQHQIQLGVAGLRGYQLLELSSTMLQKEHNNVSSLCTIFSL